MIYRSRGSGGHTRTRSRRAAQNKRSVTRGNGRHPNPGPPTDFNADVFHTHSGNGDNTALAVCFSYLIIILGVSLGRIRFSIRTITFFFFLRREDFSRIKSLSGKVTYFRSPVFAEASIRQNGSFTHLFLAKSIRLRMLSANNFYENYNKNGKYRCSPDTQSVR